MIHKKLRVCTRQCSTVDRRSLFLSLLVQLSCTQHTPNTISNVCLLHYQLILNLLKFKRLAPHMFAVSPIFHNYMAYKTAIIVSAQCTCMSTMSSLSRLKWVVLGSDIWHFYGDLLLICCWSAVDLLLICCRSSTVDLLLVKMKFHSHHHSGRLPNKFLYN
jgi:hypothetical protein